MFKHTITCPYCKAHKMNLTLEYKVGSFANVQCGSRACRCKFRVRITKIEGNQFHWVYELRGIDLHTRIPWPGLVMTQKSKVSGEFVAVYKARDLGFNSDQYVLVCAKHNLGNLGFTDSFSNVLKLQGKPNYWCSGCKKEHPVPEQPPAEESPMEQDTDAAE